MRMLISNAALVVVAGTAVFGWSTDPTQVDQPKAVPTPQQAQEAVQRGLVFLDQDVTKWRDKHTCWYEGTSTARETCHFLK